MVASIIGSIPQAIRALTKTGYLQGGRRSRETRVLSASVEAFVKVFAPFSSVAKRLGVNSKTLLSFCQKQEIQLELVKCDGAQYIFIL